jgi:GH15 family glucan-1,4-alpha-glucosidase
LLSHRSKLGLLSEGIDPKSGALWGNFPQSYSMVGLIRAAIRLSTAWEDAF